MVKVRMHCPRGMWESDKKGQEGTFQSVLVVVTQAYTIVKAY